MDIWPISRSFLLFIFKILTLSPTSTPTKTLWKSLSTLSILVSVLSFTTGKHEPFDSDSFTFYGIIIQSRYLALRILTMKQRFWWWQDPTGRGKNQESLSVRRVIRTRHYITVRIPIGGNERYKTSLTRVSGCVHLFWVLWVTILVPSPSLLLPNHVHLLLALLSCLTTQTN